MLYIIGINFDKPLILFASQGSTDEVRRDIKEFLSENGIDPDRPCFMQETRSLFGVKEKTKGEEQRTESTLKRRKSSDI